MRASYGQLLLLRVLLACVSPGYVHPDEYFQAQEVMAADVLGLAARRSWEFTTNQPIRSIFFPYSCCGLPYALAAGVEALPNWLIFLLPRLVMLALTLLNDWLLERICLLAAIPEEGPLLCMASSWPLLVLAVRPFSNSLELLCLTAATYLALLACASSWGLASAKGSLSLQLALCLGGVLSLGVFARASFPLFVLPLGVAVLRAWLRPDCSLLLRRGGAVLLGAFAAAAALVLLDSLYYGTLHVQLPQHRVQDVLAPLDALARLDTWKQMRVSGHFVVTPWNNFKYNTQADNLARHGLHSKFTHLLINLQLLFGPLPFLGVLYVCGRQSGGWASLTRVEKLLLACLASGTLGLSLIPHQEPRFLLPLLTPFSLLFGNVLFPQTQKFDSPKDKADSRKTNKITTGPRYQTWGRRVRVVWVAVNCFGVAFFGVLHQGGMAPMLLHLGRMMREQPSQCEDCAVADQGNRNVSFFLFYKTYMPPLALLGAYPCEVLPTQSLTSTLPDAFPLCWGNSTFLVYDLADAPALQVRQLVVQILKLFPTGPVFVVLPGQCGDVLFSDTDQSGPRSKWIKTYSAWPHISMEAPWPDSWKRFTLDLMMYRG